MKREDLDELAIAYAKDVTLAGRVSELVERYGSLRAAARVLRVDHGYLHRLRDGSKKEPSHALLRRMGLRRVVHYVRISSTTAKRG